MKYSVAEWRRQADLSLERSRQRREYQAATRHMIVWSLLLVVAVAMLIAFLILYATSTIRI